ncbi:MAG: methyltransferase [Gammaproteobacteria bacterium]|nr:methyltransferase [Gammaproteobacteria bacterium]
MRIILPLALALVLASPAMAQFTPPPLSPMGQKIEAALQSEIRTPEERARDADRRPRQTLEFFGLEDDMRVVELLPAGGWYTKILGQVLADQGELHVAVFANRIPALKEQYPALAKVRIADSKAAFTPAPGRFGIFDLGEEVSLGVTDADLVLTFRNLHNLTAESRARLNKAVFEALKPGGIYGVVDHTRRHNDPDNPENWRRMDPVLVIQEMEAAGFQFAGFSDVHYRPDDELRFEVGRKSVTGNSDRFTLKFRKP